MLVRFYKGLFGVRVKVLPVYHARSRLHTVCLIAEREAEKLLIPLFVVFGLTRPGIESGSTVSVADALSTRPLISMSDLEKASLAKSHRKFTSN